MSRKEKLTSEQIRRVSTKRQAAGDEGSAAAGGLHQPADADSIVGPAEGGPGRDRQKGWHGTILGDEGSEGRPEVEGTIPAGYREADDKTVRERLRDFL